MASGFPAYPLWCLPLSVINKIANFLTIGRSWMEFAERIDRYCNGALGFTTVALLAIAERERNPAEHILTETVRTNIVTTQTWQIVLDDMNSAAADVLPNYLQEIHLNFIRVQGDAISPAVQNSCNCPSCSRLNHVKEEKSNKYSACGCGKCPIECERKRLQDPDETLVKEVVPSGINNRDSKRCTCDKNHTHTNDNNRMSFKRVLSEKCTCGTVHNALSRKAGKGKGRIQHNGNDTEIVNETHNTDITYNRSRAKTETSNLHLENATDGDLRSKRHSTPNPQFSECIELEQRSSSESDISEVLYRRDVRISNCGDTGRVRRRLKIFVTFADDRGTHLRSVVEMLSVLKQNPNFDVKCDIDDESLVRRMLNCHDWLQMQFSTADFVILCISPAYSEYIKPCNNGENANDAFPNESRLHVRYIFNLARSEYIDNASKNRRFLPVLFTGSGATYEHLPLFLRSTTWYRYQESFHRLYNFLVDRHRELPISYGR